MGFKLPKVSQVPLLAAVNLTFEGVLIPQILDFDSPIAHSGTPGVGENLFWGTTGYYTAASVGGTSRIVNSALTWLTCWTSRLWMAGQARYPGEPYVDVFAEWGTSLMDIHDTASSPPGQSSSTLTQAPLAMLGITLNKSGRTRSRLVAEWRRVTLCWFMGPSWKTEAFFLVF